MSPFDINKEEKSILDCFTYDLTSFFFDEYEEIASEETPATVMIVYEKKLPWNELGIFDLVQFRIFFDKENLTGSNPVNVKFLSSLKNSSLEHLHGIVDRVVSIYGQDDYRKGDWDESDENAFIENQFRRVWTIEQGDSFVSIEYNENDGIQLNILFFNNMLKESRDYLEANQ